MKKLQIWKPVLSIVVALAAEFFLPNSSRHPPVARSYLFYVLAIFGGWFLLAPLTARLFRRKDWLERQVEKADFFAVIFLGLNILNIVTKKYCLIPAIFFPAPDRIISVLVEDFSYIIVDCLGQSAKLLFTGFFSGAVAGFITGISIGFSKRASYWFNPLIRILGPIPPTAWIQHNPEETASIQVEKKYVAGDAAFNGTVLKTFRYIPSVSGAYDAFGITAGELQKIGIIAETVDLKALHENSFAKLDGVPDSVE